MFVDLKLENTEYLRLHHRRNLSGLDVRDLMEINLGCHHELQSRRAFLPGQFE